MKKNIFKKHWKKILSISLTTVGSVSIVAGLAVDYHFPTFIYAAGSSSVRPFLAQINKDYSPAEIMSEAGGSSVGIRAILSGIKNIGMASKSPSSSTVGLPVTKNTHGILVDWNDSSAIKPEFDANNNPTNSAGIWQKDRLKTITIAWDGIGIIYKDTSSAKPLALNSNNIKNLYKAFAGFDKVKLSDLQPGLPNDVIKPFARSGGAGLSGTAEAFLKDSHLISSNQLDKKIEDALHHGGYGSNTEQTQEANMQAFTQTIDFKESGYSPMVYLSAGFIANNKDAIKKAGFKIAEFQDDMSKPPVPIQAPDGSMNVASKYKWFRPFNLIIRLKTASEGLKNFISWYFDQIKNNKSGQLMNLLSINGYVPLTNNQIDSMLIPKYDQNKKAYVSDSSNVWVSDYELLTNDFKYSPSKPDTQTQRLNAKSWYGAVA